jgi:DNA-binding transcriptional MocR family regulator
MAEVRGEPFQLALAALRDQLRTGRLRPGQRLAASGLAESLRFSATPVREALSRLAGEGLIEERRGQGYFARAWSGDDVADLYRISLAHLEVALKRGRPPPLRPLDELRPEPSAIDVAVDPVVAVEQVMLGWVRAAGGRALLANYSRVSLQLGPVRRQEPLLFEDLAEEAARLLGGPGAGPERVSGVRRFHGRRIAAATRLTGLLDRDAGPEV